MNAVLDYDVLEMLGAALREQHTSELDEPLNGSLLALCRRLEAEDAESVSPAAPRARDDG